MLTRTDSDGTTRFEWDGFDCIRELAPPTGSAVFDTAQFDSAEFGSSGRTDYYVVNGQLRQLVRDGSAYTVTSDALGSVRLVADEAGTAICSFDYDSWGQLLPSSVDNLSGGMPYRYVGAYGVRWDTNTGLHYMRNRWYSPDLQRFISRDPEASSTNAYDYAGNNPSKQIDPRGQHQESGSPVDNLPGDLACALLCGLGCARLVNPYAIAACTALCTWGCLKVTNSGATVRCYYSHQTKTGCWYNCGNFSWEVPKTECGTECPPYVDVNPPRLPK
jgi:RHS repeat-associated protein